MKLSFHLWMNCQFKDAVARNKDTIKKYGINSKNLLTIFHNWQHHMDVQKKKAQHSLTQHSRCLLFSEISL